MVVASWCRTANSKAQPSRGVPHLADRVYPIESGGHHPTLGMTRSITNALKRGSDCRSPVTRIAPCSSFTVLCPHLRSGVKRRCGWRTSSDAGPPGRFLEE